MAACCISRIAIDRKVKPPVVRVTIKQSKTGPFQQEINLFLGVTEHTVYLVKAILPYLVWRRNNNGPLFISADEIPQLSSTLAEHCRLLKTQQLPRPKQQECQMLGHWQNSAYQQYIMTPREQLTTFSIGN